MANLPRIRRRVFAIVSSMFVLSASILFGSALSASGDSDDTTFHACLHQGNLLQVDTAPQTCKIGTPISWNAIGPEGPQGEQGPQGDQGPQGEPGEGADLSSSQLYTLELLDRQRCDATPEPGIDLSHCALFQRSFVGADFSGAVMVETNLSAADLTDANLSGADLTEATMVEINLLNADMSGAILNGAKMLAAGVVGADLRNAKLIDADLAFANMSGSNLSNADLSGANLSNVTWRNTTCPNGTNSDDEVNSGFCTPG